MSAKKHELLLVCGALFLVIASMLYSVFRLSKYGDLNLTEQTERPYYAEYSATTVNRSKKININTADIGELMQLEDIGEKKAQAIIDHRKKNGNFTSPEEITEVYGIGEAIFNKNIDRITV